MTDSQYISVKYNYNFYHLFFIILTLLNIIFIISLYNNVNGWINVLNIFKFPLIVISPTLSILVVFMSIIFPPITIEQNGIRAFYRKFGKYRDVFIEFSKLEYKDNKNYYFVIPAINFVDKSNDNCISILFPKYIINIKEFINNLEIKIGSQPQLRKDLLL